MGLPPKQFFGQLLFLHFAVGMEFFFEIAKLPRSTDRRETLRNDGRALKVRSKNLSDPE